jgi:hypothetical protein
MRAALETVCENRPKGFVTQVDTLSSPGFDLESPVSSMTVQVAQLASSLSQSSTANEIGVAVLKKAMDSQRAVAAGLLQALPPVPSLASEGSLGTKVNAFA